MPREASIVVEGDTVRGTLHLPEGPVRGVIVFNHGLASDSREFWDVPEVLASRGFATFPFDRRGHGRSTGERGRVSREDALADLRAVAAWLRGEPELRGHRLGVVGHSMGSALAIYAVSRSPDFEAAALVSPLATVLAELKPGEFPIYRLAHAVSRAKTRLGLGPLAVPYRVNYKDVSHDPAAAERAERAGYLQRTISLANYDEIFAIDAAAWARDVKVPTLCVLARYDKVIRAASSRRVYEALPGPKEVVVLDHGHTQFGDARKQELIDHLDRWFGQHLA